jgi:predicted ATPase
MSSTLPGIPNLNAGSLFAGRYRLERELGRGGMGVVFGAQDLERKCLVAIKVLLAGQDRGEEISRRFRREFRAVQRLSHPNVVAVHEYGVFERQTYFTMEHVEGQNLRAFLNLSPGRPDVQALNEPARLRSLLEAFRQIGQALVAIHGQRILHRDLKPSNILVTPAGRIKIMDFGLVRPIDEDASRLTQQGVVVGTVAYMSPEQALGARMDFRSDLYSVGVILYEALAGRRPFLDPSVTGLLLKQVHEKPYPVSAYNASVPQALESIALRLLEKEPFARLQSAEELLDALEAAAQELDGAAAGAGRPAAPGSTQERAGAYLLPPRFIGRDKEVRQLRARVEALSSGQGGFMLVGGESGIGKSRLIEEIRGLGRLHQVQFLRGQCFEGSVTPYGVFLGPLERLVEGLSRRSLGEQRAALGREGRALVQLSPRFLDLAAVAELPPLESLSPAQERYRVFSAVTTLLRHLAGRRPPALILEDLHWADALSMDLLGHLVRNLVHPAQELDAPDLAAPVLLLGTYRDDEIQDHPLKSLIPQLRRRRQLEPILLGRLDLEQVAAFLQSMLAMDEPPRHLAQRIFQESEGNPFFIEEIMKSLLDEGILRREAQGWVLDYDVSSESSLLEPGSVYARLKIPVSIQDAVNKRLERLAPQDQKILACAAVIGREFSFDLLLAVTETDEDALLDAIDSFLKNAVITERSGVQDSFDFYHAKIREVLYSGLRQRERLRYHRKIALAAERLYAAEIERHYEFLAHHCFAAGLQDKAVEYLYKAGRSFQERYLNQEAINHFRRAIAILDAKGVDLNEEETLVQLSCLHALGQVLHHTGQLPAAMAAFQRMKSVARSRSLAVQTAWALLGCGQCELRLGNYSPAKEAVEEAQRIFLTQAEILGLAFSHKVLAGVEIFQHHFAEAGEQYRQALALFDRLGVKQELAAVLGDIGVNCHQQRRLDEAEAAYRRSLDLHRDLGDRGGMARVLINLAVTCMEQGQYATAFEYLADSIRLNQEVGNRSNVAVCFQNQGLFFLNLGQYSDALHSCGKAVELSEELGQRYYLCQALYNHGAVFLALGDLFHARQSLQRALSIAEEIDVLAHVAHTLFKLGRLAQQEGSQERAAALYRRAHAAGRQGRDEEAATRAELRLIGLEAPDPSHEPSVVELLAKARQTGSQEYQTDVCLDACAFYARLGQVATAEALALEALDKANRSGFREARLLASEWLGRLAEGRDDLDAAAARFAEALGALEDLLEHVPEPYRESFLSRADLAALLQSARVLAERSGSSRLCSALEPFDSAAPPPEGHTATLARRPARRPAPPDPSGSEPTDAIDYEKLGVPGRRPGP